MAMGYQLTFPGIFSSAPNGSEEAIEWHCCTILVDIRRVKVPWGEEELKDIDVFGMHIVNTAEGGRIYFTSFIFVLAFGNPSDLPSAWEC